MTNKVEKKAGEIMRLLASGKRQKDVASELQVSASYVSHVARMAPYSERPFRSETQLGFELRRQFSTRARAVALSVPDDVRNLDELRIYLRRDGPSAARKELMRVPNLGRKTVAALIDWAFADEVAVAALRRGKLTP